jgi:hypothetical protein
MRKVNIAALWFVSLTFIACFALQSAERTHKKFVVVQFNIGTYGDYQGLRDPGFKIKNKDLIHNERNKLLKDFFKTIKKQIKPDIITLQEVYGFDPEIENKAGAIKDIIAKFNKKYGYVLIEDKASSFQRNGDAIILYKEKRFDFLESISLNKRSLVLLQVKKEKTRILVSSAHLAGFEITGKDSESMSGDGRQQLVELLGFMEQKEYDDCLKIVGLDANTPPEGMVFPFKDSENEKFTIISDRLSLFLKCGYETGCPITPGFNIPSPTAINHNVTGGIRLDYVWAKAPIKQSIILIEDDRQQKEVAPYALFPLLANEKTIGKKAKNISENIPISDHLPLVYEISLQ